MSNHHFISVVSFIMLTASMLACNLGGSGSNEPVSSAPQAGSSSSGACANPFYPVVVGASWTYSFNVATLGTFTRSITAINAAGFSDQDVFSSSITRTGEWKCSAGALIALKPNNGSTAAVKIQSTDSNFQTTSMDGVTLPAAINSGDTWVQNFTLEGYQTINGVQVASKNVVAYTCTASGTESVTVPAGTFDAVHMECRTDMTITITMNGADIPTNISTTSTMWYAPGVGLVKSDNVVSGESG